MERAHYSSGCEDRMGCGAHLVDELVLFARGHRARTAVAHKVDDVRDVDAARRLLQRSHGDVASDQGAGAASARRAVNGQWTASGDTCNILIIILDEFNTNT